MKPFRGKIKTATIIVQIEAINPLEFVKAMGKIHASLWSDDPASKPDMVILP